MRSRRRRAGLIGALVGVAAAGAAVGLAAERLAVGRARIGGDEGADEPFGLLPADQALSVSSTDGVELHVEVVGCGSADITVVFVHGFCLDMGTWHFQRLGLADLRKPRIDMVFYDQRGHGRSGRGEPANCTIEQLGRDLESVINAVAPTGPLVLCGHSMGGMSVMALAEQRPEVFVQRVVGVALVSTSAGDLDTVSFGMPRLVAAVRKPLMPLLASGMRSRARLLEGARRKGSDVTWLATRRWAFGTRAVSPALVDYVERMNSSTPVETIAAFLSTLSNHMRYEALAAFDGIETIVICGERDLMTPVDHSRKLAEALPGCEFVEIAAGGHLMLMDHAEEVNLDLRSFLERALRAVPRSRRRRRG